MATFAKTQRGNPKLIFEGKSYTKSSSSNGTNYWKCVGRECSGRVRQKDDTFRPTETQPHIRLFI